MPHPTRFLLFLVYTLGSASPSVFGGSADSDWQSITALDAGPDSMPKTPAEARPVFLAHLGKQEKALRAYLKEHPSDVHRVETRLRLARVLQLKADVQDAKIVSPEVDTLIKEAEKMAGPVQRADAKFARISYDMRSMREPTPQQKQRLLDAARSFQSSFPEDRRLAALLAEVATLFDLDPKTKQALLIKAQAHATDEELRARITDDLRRVELVGQPISLRFAPEGADAIDIADHRGKVVVLIFFAAWSPPAVEAILKLQKELTGFSGEKVQFFGVSLDSKREPLEALVTEQKIEWPIICDGQAWESPLVRSLGVNALPTVWLIDREGCLRSLDALTGTASQVKQAAEAKK